MTAARMAVVYDDYRRHMAQLARRAFDAGHLGTSEVLGGEARRAGQIADALLDIPHDLKES